MSEQTTALAVQSTQQKPSSLAVLSSFKLSPGSLVVEDGEQLKGLCALLIESGYIQNQDETRLTVAQAVTKALYGHKMGLDALESINDLYVQKGQVQAYARLHARKVEEHPAYAIKLLKLNPKECAIRCFKNVRKDAHGRIVDWGEPEDEDITYTFEQAKEQGLLDKKFTPWRFDPESMLYNKCVTRAYRRYFQGLYRIPVMTVEEAQEIQVFEERAEKSGDLAKFAAERAAQKAARKPLPEEMFEPSGQEETYLYAEDAECVAEIIEEEPKTPKVQFLEAAAEIAREIGEPERAEKIEGIIEFRQSETPFPDTKVTRQEAVALHKLASEKGFTTKDLVAHLSQKYELKEKTWASELTKGQLAETQQWIEANKRK